MTKHCEHCGKVLAHPKNKYCSRRCFGLSRLHFRRCQNCGRKFHVWMNEVEHNHARYCSRKCRDEGMRRRILTTCAYCHQYLEIRRFRKRRYNFCSHRCHVNFVKKNTWTCAVCGISLEAAIAKYAKNGSYREKRTAGRIKTCSRRCGGKLKAKKQPTNCFTCGQRIYRTPRLLQRYNFCSRACMYVWRSAQRRQNGTEPRPSDGELQHDDRRRGLQIGEQSVGEC